MTYKIKFTLSVGAISGSRQVVKHTIISRETNMQNQFPVEKYLNRITILIQEIVTKSVNGNYIYRGEPEHYEKVSSTLYRISPTVFDSGEYDLENLQKESLKNARNHIHDREKDDFALLTQLQHYGDRTNLIDFTTDHYISLFFACNGSHDKDGRIILLQRTEEINKKYQIKIPLKPPNRVEAQKSIFAQPPQGFIDPNDLITVTVPADLKQWILIYLRNFQDISTQSIYNDLHGFIRNKDLRYSHEANFPLVFAEITLKHIVEYDLTAEERQEALQKAIEGCTQKLQYAPYEVTLYVKQGQYYSKVEQFDLAIETFSKAILLKSDYVDAYFWRGLAFYFKKEVDFAQRDFDKVKELNPDYSSDLAQKLEGKLPEDLISMLTDTQH